MVLSIVACSQSDDGATVADHADQHPDDQLSPLHERSLREVAEALGMSVQMVHIVEQRALDKLRRILRAKRWGREEEAARGR